MSASKIEFENGTGEKLSARIEVPIDRRPHNFAIFAHCFTCNKNFKAVRSISSALAARGFGVLSFDFTGLGESEGDFAETTFSGSVEDLIGAANFLEQNYQAPSLIVGHSLGGAASLFAAGRLNSIKAVVTIGSPSAPQHVKHLISHRIDEIKQKGQSEVNIGGRPFLIKLQFVDDLEKQDLLRAVTEMRKAFLFLHSPDDKTVPVDNATRLFTAARHPKSFVSLSGADHLLSAKEDARYAGDLIGSWAARYLDIPEESNLFTSGHVVAYLGSDEKFTTRIKAGAHRIVADEPVSFGGDDFGPSPYQLVASGLAACTAMTMRLYAERKKWDLREIYVHVNHEKVHGDDCLKCESAEGKIDKFERKIELIGDLNDEHKKRLLEIADKCPVHRTLESESLITTTLAD